MKIIIETPTWLGDSVMISPAIENIINHYDEPEVTLIGSEISIEVLKNHPKVVKTQVLDKKLIKRNYHAPYSTYEMINKNKIFRYLEKTSPTIAENFDQFDLCYPKPSIFLTVHN